jgi:hypothetical protein
MIFESGPNLMLNVAHQVDIKCTSASLFRRRCNLLQSTMKSAALVLLLATSASAFAPSAKSAAVESKPMLFYLF